MFIFYVFNNKFKDPSRNIETLTFPWCTRNLKNTDYLIGDMG